jgi:hypothetical protein
MGQVKTLPAIFRLKAEATPPQRGWLPALAGRSEADY